jgi:hypothetical protein
VTVALATPLTKGAAVPGVTKGPFGPVLALLGAGGGAPCPDIAMPFSCAKGEVVVATTKEYGSRSSSAVVSVCANTSQQDERDKKRFGIDKKSRGRCDESDGRATPWIRQALI